MNAQDMPEFHEAEKLMVENQRRHAVLQQTHGISLSGSEVLARRLEAFIDWILPDGSSGEEIDDDLVKARIRFELSWQKILEGSLDNAEKLAREHAVDPMGLGKKPSGLIVPGR